MKSPEDFIPSESEIEEVEKETAPKSPEVEIAEIGSEQSDIEALEASRELQEVFVKDGPKFRELLNDSFARDNRVISEAYPSAGSKEWRKYSRAFTEREGLANLSTFLETTITTAQEVGNKDVGERATFLKENLVYVGERELQEAVGGIAERLAEVAKSGRDVFVYTAGLRSERYISLRILEELDLLCKDERNLRDLIHFSESESEIAKRVKDLGEKAQIFIPDDFAISGTRIRGFAERMFAKLLEQGYSPEEASNLLEADLVADVKPRPDQKETRHRLTYGKDRKMPMRVFAYYGIEPPISPKGGDYVLGGAVTGSHASVDYGFESPVEDFHKFLASQEIQVEMPLLTKIQRPYEFDDAPGSRKYKDPELQARWEAMMKKYRFESK